MNHVRVPPHLLSAGVVVPVDVVNPKGLLLMRRGERIQTDQHLGKLLEHGPSVTPSDARTWQRAYERAVQRQLNPAETASLADLSQSPAPVEAYDFVKHTTLVLKDGWLDAQELLRALLYQGSSALEPLARLQLLQNKTQEWLQADADEALLCLFQTLSAPAPGYCASHALLCLVITQLTAEKLGLPEHQRRSLRLAALSLHFGFGRALDAVVTQNHPLSEVQRAELKAHPSLSYAALLALGVDDAAVLDLVRWQNEPDHPQASADNSLPRLVLHMVNELVGKMAARKSGHSWTSKDAVRALYMIAAANPRVAQVSAAMASAVSFFPPGSYVRLHNGDTAVSVRRGPHANTPWVVPILNPQGMPYGHYRAYPSTPGEYAIAQALNFEKVRVTLHLEKIREARERID